MNGLDAVPFGSPLEQLRAVRLRITTPRIAVLQALQSEPDQWFCADGLYRILVERGVEASLGTLYRVMNELAVHGLLLRQVDEHGKRFFRFRPSSRALHRIVCSDTGCVLALTDDISPDHLASVLRSQGLMLTDAPMTVQVQCTREPSHAR